MSEPLSLRNFFLPLLLLLLINCGINYKENERKNITSEIICSDTKRYMIRYVYADELKQAIYHDIHRQKMSQYKVNFTVIRIPRIESFHIPNTIPQDLLKCQITDNYIKKVYPNYIRKFR